MTSVLPTLSSCRPMPLQAILMSAGIGNVLSPLSETIPNVLLPVCNQPLLAYQLANLERAGFRDVMVAVEFAHAKAVQAYVEQHSSSWSTTISTTSVAKNTNSPNRDTTSLCFQLKVEVIGVDASQGSADVLRFLKDHIRGDFCVMAGDLVCEDVLCRLVDAHRLQSAAVTMMHKVYSEAAAGKMKGRKATPVPVKKKKVHEIVGLAGIETSKTSNLDVYDVRRVLCVIEDPGREAKFALPKSLLRRMPSMTIHSDVEDMHLYVFAHWTLRLLEYLPQIRLLKEEFVPYLVHRQFRGLYVFIIFFINLFFFV